MGFFDKLKGGMGIEEERPKKSSAAKAKEDKEKKKAKPESKLKTKVKSKIKVKAEAKPEVKPEPKQKIKPPQTVKKEEPLAELPTEGELAIDVFETNGDIVVQSTIGGVKPEDLDISVENDLVTIRGSREKSIEKESKKYFYQECYWGSFMRQVILPEEVDGARAKATMKNGVLTLVIPKLHRKKKRKIAVQSEE